MDELKAAVEEYIREEYLKAIDATSKNPNHKADVDELNKYFDEVLKAYNAARSNVYFHIEQIMSNFFEKGFRAGITFFYELFEEEDPNND